ncbi:MAG: SDR family NAD(P)-dependent oxidoreductase [Thermoplasmata archaeon]
MSRFDGKVVVVTGGTRGIGLAIARGFHREGATVIAIGRDEEQVKWTRDAFGADPRMRVELADVRDRASLTRVGESLEELHVLVANAGVAARVEALELDDISLRAIIDTNFYGVFLTCQVFGPLLLRQPGGRVVMTSSISAVHGQKLRAAYAGSKGAVSALTRALAVEWGPKGATVNAVAPGIIRTPLIEGYLDANPGLQGAATERTALRRLGEPDDVADVVLFFASAAARYVTGQTLIVDGGLTMGSDWW